MHTEMKLTSFYNSNYMKTRSKLRIAKLPFHQIFTAIALFCLLSIDLALYAQKPNVIKRDKGVEYIHKDSAFSIRFSFRAQQRAGFFSKSLSDMNPETFEMRVRRLRLGFRGFIYDPSIQYYIQLSFSRGDMDWESPNATIYNTSPNIIRDAMIFYVPVKGLTLGLGQTKLPGNRQRVVSSGSQQFYDRSIVNATFTLDRDFGFFSTYQHEYFRVKAAITSGEGRNSTKSDFGLNYTLRGEILPFGKFTGDNEDWEGDLAREPKPKLSIAAGYNINSRAVRQGGTLGNDLYNPVTMKNLHADLSFKYKGFALMHEFCNRAADAPITVKSDDSSSIRTVYVGWGINTQMSYLFKNNYEVAARYARITPDKSIYENSDFSGINEKGYEQYIVGVTRYLNGHKLKVQGNLLYQKTNNMRNHTFKDQLGAFFQIELGI